MGIENPVDKLKRLSEAERLVFETYCKLKSPYWKIGRELGMAEGTVKVHMSAISSKLEVSDLKRGERKKVLLQVFCPALRDKAIGPPAPDSNREMALVLTKQEEEIVNELEFPLVEVKPEELKPIRGRVVFQPSRTGWMFVGLIAGLAIMYFVLNGISPSEPQLIVVTPTPQPEEVGQAIAEPTEGSASAEDQIEAAAATATSPAIAPTSTLPPIQPVGFSFSDDFEAGPDPLWEVITGEVGMANGKFTVIAPYEEGRSTRNLAVLSEIYWGNVRVIAEIDEFNAAGSCCSATSIIVIRYLEGDESIGLMISSRVGALEFGTLKTDGEWVSIPSSQVDWYDYGYRIYQNPHEISVEAIGNTYIAYIEGTRVTSATIQGPTWGQIGLWFDTSEGSSDARAYAARYEFITIESLP